MMNLAAIEITCRLCGDTLTLIVDADDLAAYEAGGLVQDCFPYLTASERELIISGTCPACWDEMFGEDEDEEDEPCYDCDDPNLEMGFDPYEGGYTFDC